MVNYAGVSVPVLLEKESVFGTAVTPIYSLGYMTNVNVTERNTLERVHGLGARNAQAIVAKKYEATGSLEGTYYTSRLLALALGKVTSTDSNPSANLSTHKIEEADTIPSFTLEASMMGPSTTDDILRRYAGCAINTMRLTMGIDQPLRFSADFLAKTVSYTESGTASTATFDSNAVLPLAPQHASLVIDGTNAVGQVQNLEFNINNNLEYVFGLGSRLAQANVAKTRTYDLRATVTFNASGAATDSVREIVSRMLGDAATPFIPSTSGPTEVATGAKISITNAAGTATTRNDLTISLDGFNIDEMTISEPVDGLVSIDFSAFCKSLNSTNAISAVDAILKASYINAGADF